MNKDELIKSIVQHDDHNIKGFFYEYRFLSNMEDGFVYYQDIMYPASENAYQAAKTLDVEKRKKVAALTSYKSKSEGKRFKGERPDWDDVKADVMREVVLDKFTRNPRLRLQLIATGDKYLEEANYWGDTYWGVCKGVGLNMLGKILMETREKIKSIC